MSALREVMEHWKWQAEGNLARFGEVQRPAMDQAEQAERELEQVREALGVSLDWMPCDRVNCPTCPDSAVCEIAAAYTVAELSRDLLSEGSPAVPSVSVPVERLREIEWRGTDGITLMMCPVCAATQWVKPHDPDCWIAAALRDAKKEERCSPK